MGAPYALSSNLVSAWPAKSLEVAQYIDGQLPLIAMTQNAQTGTTYTLAATDFTKLVTLSNASAVTVTVPLESSVAWVAGTQLRLMNLGAGVVTVVGAGGVTINGSPLTLAQYKQGTLTKTGTNTWTFTGSPSAPGLDLVGTAAPSAASSVIISNCFSATYDNYRVLVAVTSTTAGYVSFNLRTGSTDAITNYSYQYISADSTSLSAARSSSQTVARVGYMQATARVLIAFDIASPFLAAFSMYSGFGTSHGSAVAQENYSGSHITATSYESLTITFPAAVTGTIKIYGYRNS